MKKFEKGCAVDVRGMSEVMFNTIKRVGSGVDNGKSAQFEGIGKHQEHITFSAKIDSWDYEFTRAPSIYDLLTPTDILGPELVKALEKGYTPWFEGDSISCQRADIVLSNGAKLKVDNIFDAEKRANIIAYKPIEQPAIESTILSSKVNEHNHYFKDVSHLETVDVYRVINLFNVTNPCHQHAIKKILCCGHRGAKDAAKDTQEAIDSLSRALEMMREDDERK